MHITLFSGMPSGIGIQLIEVEVSFSKADRNGKITIIGLSDTDARTCILRIKNSLLNHGIDLPDDKRILINLAPAHIKKIGTYFDLAILTGILIGLRKIPPQDVSSMVLIGEISIDGRVRPILGALSMAIDLPLLGKKKMLASPENIAECAHINVLELIAIPNLTGLISYFKTKKYIAPRIIKKYKREKPSLDFKEVIGQEHAKRACLISAAGSHNIIMIGSPGSGKTMLAQRMIGILPPLNDQQSLETSRIYSLAGSLNEGLIKDPPLRSPHHSSSSAGVLGGGHRFIQPGDVSLSHNGILFLDEMAEFRRSLLDSLRQPLEDGVIHIRRANYQITLPAHFLLIGATNPCPCGYFNDPIKECKCPPLMRKTYINRLSGPLLDRIDLQVGLNSMQYNSIKSTSSSNTTSNDYYQQVIKARAIQYKRQNKLNSELSPHEIQIICVLTSAAEKMIGRAFDYLKLTMRGYHKLLKVAKTISDLDGKDTICESQIREALLYRQLDKYIQ